MNYPIWELDWLGGPSLIALVSIIHVYVAQLAVGGGIFLFFLDWWAQRSGDAGLLDFVRTHTRFFLLLTMVFGGVTGVGIWFTIAVVNPAATSLLVHEYVFAWAIEWVFFMVEIVALLVYHYAFDALRPTDRLKVAGIYAFAAWASLVVIGGILSFMLTPGGWVESGSFWDGFFNPTFLPSVVFRTSVALSLAGLFALITAMRQRFEPIRVRLVRIGVAWLLAPVVGLAVGGWWYVHSVPEDLRVRALELNPESGLFVSHGLAAAGLLLVLALVMLAVPRSVGRVVVALMVLTGLMATGSFEYLREIARKPWVVPGVMYANGLTPEDVERARREGLLAIARWDFSGPPEGDTLLHAGRELFNLQCLACHTRGGVYNDILERTAHLEWEGLRAWLEGMGRVRSYMPPFAGNEAERDALAAYLASIHGKPYSAPEWPEPPAPLAAQPPPRVEGDWVLLAWSDLGMQVVSDCDRWFEIAPAGNTLEAVLVQRAGHPVRITDDVTIGYRVESLGLEGQLEYDEGAKAWRAEGLEVLSAAAAGGFDPYPLVTVQALDSTGVLLAASQAVLPTTSELRCLGCHGGGWRDQDHQTGISDATAQAVLVLHDRDNGTDLVAQAQAGQPQRCQACHGDAREGVEGQPGVLSLSAAMHGWHATMMHLEQGDACASCHPAHPQGATRGFRGLHASRGLSCTMCHGALADHAAALLKAEPDAPASEVLIAGVLPDLAKPLDDIEPRQSWLQQPDCQSCHVEYQAPSAYNAFNRWAGTEDLPLYGQRTGVMGVRCVACHGSAHALYPARNPTEQHRDNLQPLRYTGLPFPMGSESSCTACHTVLWPMSPHHPNMVRPFRGFERREWVSETSAGDGATVAD